MVEYRSSAGAGRQSACRARRGLRPECISGPPRCIDLRWRPFTDVDDLLARIPLDGVVIATPHTTHFAAAEAALRVGVNVLVEKPLATTASDAWALVELARERSCLLAAA